MKELKYLPNEVLDEVMTYLDQLGERPFDWAFDLEEMTEESDIEYWLNNKLKHEGPIKDEELIKQIAWDQKIWKPIVIDTSNEYTVEGRHRLHAALKHKIPVPTVCLFKK